MGAAVRGGVGARRQVVASCVRACVRVAAAAMAVYNSAIYLGRGAMYLVFNAAKELQAHQPEVMDAVSREVVQRDLAGNL